MTFHYRLRLNTYGRRAFSVAGTHFRILSGIQRAAQTVLCVYIKCTRSRVNSASSALGVLTIMCYTNPRTHSNHSSKLSKVTDWPRVSCQTAPWVFLCRTPVPVTVYYRPPSLLPSRRPLAASCLSLPSRHPPPDLSATFSSAVWLLIERGTAQTHTVSHIYADVHHITNSKLKPRI